ncbi:MAG: cobalamin biosynthesis protein CobD [Bacteroidaceae bacterium]|nr:cobalamin biosynthesis protein CobD [Bacteroidaceae bacterium]
MLLSFFTLHSSFFILFALLLGWLLDLCFGDPARLPHPIVWFGKAIAACEHRYNRGSRRKLKGAIVALTLIIATFLLTAILNYTFYHIHYILFIAFNVMAVFFCLAGTTLIREVRAVFLALDRSLDEGRRQVARIVGRDTSELSAQEVRTAALETLAENLSDGVVAPLFWFALLGAPGMLTYKMINTLDSMIGYRTERYRDFGCWAAHIDDIANYVPARLTALLMALPHVILHCSFSIFHFIRKFGRSHASPNSGYPEAALAGILNCRFGGPHYYFGELFDKPYIGDNARPLTTEDMRLAVRVNRTVEVLMVGLTALAAFFNPRLIC